ncbi:putative reverse transcriptase domain-containing protein [Tanacetum coccineum]
MTTTSAGRSTAALQGGNGWDKLIEELEELENQLARKMKQLVNLYGQGNEREQLAEMQILGKTQWKLERLDQEVAVYLNGYVPLWRLSRGSGGGDDVVASVEREEVVVWWVSAAVVMMACVGDDGGGYGGDEMRRCLAPQIRGIVAATKPATIQKAVQKAGTLIDEAIRNGPLKKNTEKRVMREYTGTTPKYKNCNLHHSPESPCRACFICNRLGHLAKECRVVPRMVNPMNAKNPTAARGACFECGGTDHFKAAYTRLNQVQRPGGGRPTKVVAINEGQGYRNNGNRARGEAFMLRAEEARHDPNIMTGTFTLNNHYAITLFNSGADYNFISTAFTPLLGIDSSDLRFSYEIEIASGQLVEIDKVIRGCKLEIEGHTFDIDLIPFGSRSFDVIVGIDWFSKHKTEIIFHEKVVRIPLRNGKTLRVVCERPEEKVRHLRSAKAKEQNKEDIVVVRNFPEVFPDDFLGLPPNQEIEFCFDLIPGAIPVARSPYRLAPSEMEELSGQLK